MAHAEKAERAHATIDFARDLAVALPLLATGHHFLLDKARRSTLVDSMITKPAPPAAKRPAFIRCQSVGKPRMPEYWCIGATTTRFFRVTSRIPSGVNSSGCVIA
jgi:hypothetical protein